jgi:xanthine dehydrogenase YagR molybdenum-binding subunit
VLAACRKLKAGLGSGITEAEGSVTPAELDNSYAHDAFGAHFAEVGVHRDTGEVRVRRMLGVFAAGRILNAKTARSQMIGGMIWGIGSALMEGNQVDLRYGSFLNQDLASYHVAVNADVGAIDAVLLEEADPHGSPLGSKGLGELGICGAGAAVINAIYNATGARIRGFPATPDKLLPALEALDG